jgi:hypothetical protein
VKVAVSVYRYGCLVNKSESYSGSVAGLQALALTAAVCLKVYPFDAVLGDHGVVYRAYVYAYYAVFYRNYGNVFFMACFNYARFELFHFLSAAEHGDACVMNHAYDIAAMFANIKFHFIHNCNSP